MKSYAYILSFSLAMLLGSCFVYGQNSDPPKDDKAIIHPDTLVKKNSEAKQKNVPDSLKKDQHVFKPEKASTCNGDNNPLRKPE